MGKSCRTWKKRSHMQIIIAALLLLLTASCAHVIQDEVVVGSYTYHVVNNGSVSKKYSRKVTDDGRLINNNLLGYRRTDILGNGSFYISKSVFVGENSITEPIFGGSLSLGQRHHNLFYGGVLGLYIQDYKAYEERGIEPFSIGRGRMSVVPIFGGELNYQINLGKKYFMKLNNVITPVLTNHSVSFGVEY